MKRILLVVTLMVFAGFDAHAQTTVPPLVNYQGRLTDANGQGLMATVGS